jgi:hypothetical protein
LKAGLSAAVPVQKSSPPLFSSAIDARFFFNPVRYLYGARV